MKKVCIFRVSGGRNWYRVFRDHVRGVGIVYLVYEGRKHIPGVWLFFDFDKAVDVAVALAKANVYFIEDGEAVQ